MSRLYPAIEIRFASEVETALDLRDRLLAGLDDFSPTAIEEATSQAGSPARRSPVAHGDLSHVEGRPPRWGALWRVFFESIDARDRALAWLRARGDARIATEPLEVADDDWARRSQADLRAVRVGRVIVSPPWCADEARSGASDDDLLVVVLPSTGFGTGHHASTRLCLALLQDVTIRDRHVLDVGTGSGVLAIAAAGLGAASVIGVDNDPDAIAAARENVALNRYAGGVVLQTGDLETLRVAPADLVLANLTGELLRRSAASLVRCAAPGADLVVSGVLAEERDRVVAGFEAVGARLRTVRTEDEWVGLLLGTDARLRPVGSGDV